MKVRNTKAETNHSPEIRTKGWFIISSLASGHAVFHWLSQSSVVVFPEIQSTFNLSGIGVGVILAVQQLASGLVFLPGGILADILRNRWNIFLPVCIALFSLGTLMMGTAPLFHILLAGMGVVAISHSLWHLPASASLSSRFPKNRGAVLSLHGVGGSIGDVAGPIATGLLLALLSWRGILNLYAVLAIISCFLAFWSFKNIADTGTNGTLINRRDVTLLLLKHRVLWAITLVKGLRGMALIALFAILPLYFDSDIGLSPNSRGLHIGLLIAAGITTKPIVGQLSDSLGRKQVLVPCLILSAIASLLLLTSVQGMLLTLTIIFLGLFLYPDQPIVTVTTLEMVDENVASTALGLSNSASCVLSSLSPLIAGILYEFIGMDAAVYYLSGLFIAAAIVFSVIPLDGSKPSSQIRQGL